MGAHHTATRAINSMTITTIDIIIPIFDNLALEQLSVKENIPNDIYEKGFMGNDGESTMYIDLVKGEFAVSSTATNRYKITNNIKEMFSIVKTQ